VERNVFEKCKYVKTGCNIARYSKESYGSRKVVCHDADGGDRLDVLLPIPGRSRNLSV
jgi:hypothetical protein